MDPSPSDACQRLLKSGAIMVGLGIILAEVSYIVFPGFYVLTGGLFLVGSYNIYRAIVAGGSGRDPATEAKEARWGDPRLQSTGTRTIGTGGKMFLWAFAVGTAGCILLAVAGMIASPGR